VLFHIFFPEEFIKRATITLCEHYRDTTASVLLFQPPKLEDLGKSPRVTAVPLNSLFKVLHYSEGEWIFHSSGDPVSIFYFLRRCLYNQNHLLYRQCNCFSLQPFWFDLGDLTV